MPDHAGAVPLIDLTGKIAVVTGGAGEIGAAISTTLARLGADVWVLDVNQERGEQVEREIAATRGRGRFRSVDATSYDEMRSAVREVADVSGPADIAVGGVGWTQAHDFVDEDPAYWRLIVDLNLMAAVHLTHLVLPDMVERRDGRIVLVSSLAGRIGRRQRALYSASKAGVIGFARAVALEHAQHDVTINCVAPGATDTDQMRSQGEENTRYALSNIPRGTFADPQDQANAVAFLVSNAARHINGQVVAVDGGATMV